MAFSQPPKVSVMHINQLDHNLIILWHSYSQRCQQSRISSLSATAIPRIPDSNPSNPQAIHEYSWHRQMSRQAFSTRDLWTRSVHCRLSWTGPACCRSKWLVCSVRFHFVLDLKLTQNSFYPDVSHPQRILTELEVFFAHVNIQPLVSMHSIIRNCGTNTGLLVMFRYATYSHYPQQHWILLHSRLQKISPVPRFMSSYHQISFTKLLMAYSRTT